MMIITTEKLPACVLRNSNTNRYHPIVFRPSPMPGLADLHAEAQRYRSIGHHADGFDTFESARDYILRMIREDSRIVWVDRMFDWDGLKIPATTQFFTRAELAGS